MQVTKINTKNFQGLKGKHEFRFGKITALAQKNGSGKTSLLNALRFGLTGVEPSGELITKGQEEVAVQIELENGKSFFRQKFSTKGKSSRFGIGKTLTTQSKLNDFISNELGGVPNGVAKAISSGELLTSMTSDKFGEMLLNYLPEEMTTSVVLDKFPDSNENQKKIISDFLPEGEFPLDELNKLYQFAYEKRKNANAKLSNKQAAFANMGNEIPELTQEEIEAQIAELMQKRDVIVNANLAIQNYNQISQAIELRDAQIKQIDEELASLTGVEHTEEEFALVKQSLSNSKSNRDKLFSAIKTIVNGKEALDLALENLKKPTCPLSDKIVCTVDKTPALGELEEKREKFIEDYKKQTQEFKEIDAQVVNLENQYTIMMEEHNNFLRLQDKQKQKEQLLNQKYVLPEKPESSETVEAVEQKLNQLQNMLTLVKQQAYKESLKEEISALQEEWKDYDGIVNAFAPKGVVKESITSYYMDAFSEPCNEKAKQLFPNMTVKFVTEQGVKVMVDTNGQGEYLKFESLSGGEKASVMFLLISMLSSLSGMGIIILDEMSVLDEQVFANLVKLLVEHQDEYDMCLIACVNHKDTIETLNRYHVPLLHLSQDDEANAKETSNVQEKQSSQSSVTSEVLNNEQPQHSETFDNTSDEVNENVFKVTLGTHLDDLVNEESNLKQTDDIIEITSDNNTTVSEVEEGVDSNDDNTSDVQFQTDDAYDIQEKSQDTNVSVIDEASEKVENDIENETNEDAAEASADVNKDSEFESFVSSLGLKREKQFDVVRDIIEHIERSDDGSYILKAVLQDISDRTGVSNPTISKIIKTLEEECYLHKVGRGSYEVDDYLANFKKED